MFVYHVNGTLHFFKRMGCEIGAIIPVVLAQKMVEFILVNKAFKPTYYKSWKPTR
jgi:hypothetical protein